MNYTIKGLTGTVITFNSLNITIRGNCNDLQRYPHSIARNISVTNENQWSEINAMKNAGLIEIEPYGTQAEITSKEPDKKTTKKATKTKRNYTKKIKRVETASENEKESSAVVISPDGRAQHGKMRKSSDMELQDNEIVKESLDALKKMEEEERLSKEEFPIDESKLDISERMGNEAVVSGTDKKNSKMKMKRLSSSPNWIDSGSNDKHSPFIDEKKTESEDHDDRFIE